MKSQFAIAATLLACCLFSQPIQISFGYADEFPAEHPGTRIDAALKVMEIGRVEDGRKALQQIIDEHPEESIHGASPPASQLEMVDLERQLSLVPGEEPYANTRKGGWPRPPGGVGAVS